MVKIEHSVRCVCVYGKHPNEMTFDLHLTNDILPSSASEVTTLRRYTNLFIIIIITFSAYWFSYRFKF